MGLKKKYKYLLVTERYYDCPTCDPTGGAIGWANSLKEVLQYAATTFAEEEIRYVISTASGKPLPIDFIYEKGFHSVVDMYCKIKNKKALVFIDDGRGVRKWFPVTSATAILYGPKTKKDPDQ